MQPHILVENHCSTAKIADRYLPIIPEAIAIYQSIFGAAILDIRLMGSVARGEAGPHSDIDYVALLDREPRDEELLKLEQQEAGLKQQHNFVARVDLEAVAADGLHPFRRFVFATDSISVYGADAYTEQSQTWDREELAQLITPDLADLVNSYRNAVAGIDETNETALRHYSRVIGKDILKCYRSTPLLHGGSYERSIHNIQLQLLEYLPEQRALIEELYELYAHPTDDKQRLLRVLEESWRAQ